MLKTVTLGLLASLTLLAASPAKAGLLLEPYLGYELGTLKYTTAGANFDLSTAVLGARVGVTFPVFFAALDYDTLLGGSLKQDDTAGSKWDASGNSLFLEVGANLPVVRAFIGYGLINTLEEKLNGVDNKSEGGTAIKLGLGTNIFPVVDVNLEYTHSDYDKLDGDSNNKSKSDFFMLDLSLPFDL